MKPFSYFLKIVCAALALLLACSASQAGDINKGRKLYGTNCAMCHGQNGRSAMVGAPNFDRGEGVMRPDSALLASIRAGKNACPAFRGILTDRDILDVIAFVRTLH
jgi:mono/diheme cytochrome c family protein